MIDTRVYPELSKQKLEELNSYNDRILQSKAMQRIEEYERESMIDINSRIYPEELFNREIKRYYSKTIARADGMFEMEKTMKEDMCRKCGKSFNKAVYIDDIVTLHRMMGEYWIYHIECFEEVAGPKNVPPQVRVDQQIFKKLKQDSAFGSRSMP